jgi:hypothetical protein
MPTGAADPVMPPSLEIIIRAELAGIVPEATGTICLVVAQPIRKAVVRQTAMKVSITHLRFIGLPPWSDKDYTRSLA